MPDEAPSAPVGDSPTTDKPATPALKKGDPVAVQRDGFNYHGIVAEDDDGGKTINVVNLGRVIREKVQPR